MILAQCVQIIVCHVTFLLGMSRPEDGIAKLKHLEMSKGIWTMRCQLCIEEKDIVIIDKQTQVRFYKM